jgi:hypothetical protein
VNILLDASATRSPGAHRRSLRSFSIDGTIKSAGSLTRALSLLGWQQLRNVFWPEASDINAFHEDLALFLQEFRNKLVAFSLFAHVDVALELQPGVALPLPQLVSRASTLGPYFSVWSKEGISHEASLYRLGRERAPEGLLSELHSGQIPRHNLVPLNSGMSLGLAESLLEAVDRGQQIDWPALSQFIELCLHNCSPGNHGIGLEALGLAARSLHPHLISSIDAILVHHQPDLVGYFWHGVGRAIYFSPLQSVSFWPVRWSGLDWCMREPPHSLGRANAIAGFAWALTLVNIRQPEIVAAFLHSRGKHLPDKEAFINGLCSGLLVWQDAQPDQRQLSDFLAYQPPSSTHIVDGLWKSCVQEPSEQLFRDPLELSPEDVGRLFSYRAFADLLYLARKKIKKADHSSFKGDQSDDEQIRPA